MTVRVLLVDDQPMVRAGLALLLRAEPGIEVVGEAGSGDEALALAGERIPDVVVMDVRMPGMDGVTATRHLTAAGGPAPRVLVMTTFHVDEAVHAALRAGASGFLLKDGAPSELAAAVRAVADGEGWLDPAVARQLIDEFAARPPENLPSPAELQRLTGREREVLLLMAQGWSNREIAEHLVLGEGTVKTHVGHILTKLAVRDRAQAVVVAYRTGFVATGGGR
jgi:DNA-binding NarL/FixJ family response regulator